MYIKRNYEVNAFTVVALLIILPLHVTLLPNVLCNIFLNIVVVLDEATRRQKMEEMVRKELETWDADSRPGTGK